MLTIHERLKRIDELRLKRVKGIQRKKKLTKAIRRINLAIANQRYEIEKELQKNGY